MVDWNLLKTPDYLGTYVNALQAGRAHAKERATDAAYQTYASDPQAGINALSAIDPQTAMQLQNARTQQQHEQTTWDQQQADRTNSMAVSEALARGDRDAAIAAGRNLGPDSLIALQQHIATLDETHRQQASQSAMFLGRLLHGIAGLPPEQRLSAAQHLAQFHPELGIKPEDLTADDVSDQGIANHISVAEAIYRAAHPQESYTIPMGGERHDFDPVTGEPTISKGPEPRPVNNMRYDVETGTWVVDPKLTAAHAAYSAAGRKGGGSGKGGSASASVFTALPGPPAH